MLDTTLLALTGLPLAAVILLITLECFAGGFTGRLAAFGYELGVVLLSGAVLCLLANPLLLPAFALGLGLLAFALYHVHFARHARDTGGVKAAETGRKKELLLLLFCGISGLAGAAAIGQLSAYLTLEGPFYYSAAFLLAVSYGYVCPMVAKKTVPARVCLYLASGAVFAVSFAAVVLFYMIRYK